jgi:transmembrane 9 superfamily protein 3
MLLVYLILVVVTVCVTIVSTYFLLNAEDYRWQWTSFLSGGSTALYVYAYAIYYYAFKTRMSGVLQTAYFFGYMAVFCFILFLLCGTWTTPPPPF